MSTRPVVAVTVNSSEFSWMLHWRQMFAGLQECGAVPLAVDCSVGPVDMEQLMGQVDGLVISGGGDVDPRRYGGDPADPTLRGVNPVRDANEIAAFEAAVTREVPTLAICRGAQLVNAHRGGTLYADLPRDRPSDVQHRPGEERLLEAAHDVDIEPESRLSRWTGVSGQLAVNSQHHQGIRDLAPGFVVSARATDGLVEGYESLDGRFTAVQWHPEINWSVCPVSRRLLEGFVSSCARAAVVPA